MVLQGSSAARIILDRTRFRGASGIRGRCLMIDDGGGPRFSVVPAVPMTHGSAVPGAQAHVGRALEVKRLANDGADREIKFAGCVVRGRLPFGYPDGAKFQRVVGKQRCR